MTLWRSTIVTPIGPMLAVASEEGLCALEFGSRERLPKLEARLARWCRGWEIHDGSSPVIEGVSGWLSAYFDGTSADASRVPLDLRGASFELRVWTALCDIPPGATSTYGAIAGRVGSPGAARAVGMANGANPVAIIVPCHRVIGANGTLTGYGGGLERKRWLLAHERRWSASSRARYAADLFATLNDLS